MPWYSWRTHWPEKGRSDFQRDFGLALRRVRVRRGLSQADLGVRAGLARAYVSRLETGGANPTLATIERLARAIDQLPHQLIKDAVTYPARRADAVGKYWTEAAGDLRASLGRVVKAFRIRAYLSQSSFAKIVGISDTHLSTIETGRGNPSLELLRRIGEATSQRPHRFVQVAEDLQMRRDFQRWRKSLGGDSWRFESMKAGDRPKITRRRAPWWGASHGSRPPRRWQDHASGASPH
jgi:transcriptional regulator with XRE-family HTH domain